MSDMWDKDRSKKRQKKLEREELRAEGLLGTPGRNGKADLSQKYAFGITMQQVHDELRTFMLDENQTSRPFPPMDKHERKRLHEVANVLTLKSKSVGSGNDRFLTLYKNSRTPFHPAMVDNAISMSMKGLLSRDMKLGKQLAKKNAKKMAKGPGGRGGASVSAATLRNGEIVGAGAAEISKESFGHKMMEKMGWSKGKALGKMEEGRLVPVEQVVRLGTAGLG